MNKTAILPTIGEDTEKEECSVSQLREGMLVFDIDENDPDVAYGIVLKELVGGDRVSIAWKHEWVDRYLLEKYLKTSWDRNDLRLIVMTTLDCFLTGKQIPTKQSDGTYKITSECDR